MQAIAARIADELSVQLSQVEAAIQLLDEGCTVPFIARYRKEVTGGLDDGDLRQLEERLRYLREMEERRASILQSIQEQGKLTPELAAQIAAASSKAELEDLYLPYKPKRRTKGQIAIEAGLQPLAEQLLQQPDTNPEQAASAYVDAEKGVADSKAALEGAKYILMERFAEDAALLGKLREFLQREAFVQAKVVDGKQQAAEKFRDYFDFQEAWQKVPSHRALALFRGRNEGFLQLALIVPSDAGREIPAPQAMIASHVGIENRQRAADAWLQDVVRWTWRIKLLMHMESELFASLRDTAEAEAIRVFAKNLQDLLLAAPAGPRTTLGLDPGFRTGVKMAIVDRTGKVLTHGAIFPHEPRNQWDQSIATLAALAQQHQVELIAIGNGTASRETDRLAAELIKRHPELKLSKIVVSEAGASVYSASEFAAKEFPDLDVTIRGAISIARRLQDPLAELVKIDPKAIGVGQYQHDVSQLALARSLDAVVEDCVNHVGVDVNTASVPLLTRVSALSASIASNIVAFRETNGGIKNRMELKKVPRLGEKTFEQAAGFLRVMNGDNPLDASAVHPESYLVVERIAEHAGKPIQAVLGDASFLKAINAADYTDERFGLPTVTDIIGELQRPGRDPRPEFVTAQFKDGIEKIADLKVGMILEGVVSNVANFGAFVDIGVHQDGLVHISALAEKFVRDPREVVKAGDLVKVKVVEVDVERKRIALSMRLQDDVSAQSAGKPAAGKTTAARSAKPKAARAPAAEPQGIMAELLRSALQKKS